jgi:hypothetical protein
VCEQAGGKVLDCAASVPSTDLHHDPMPMIWQIYDFPKQAKWCSIADSLNAGLND